MPDLDAAVGSESSSEIPENASKASLVSPLVPKPFPMLTACSEPNNTASKLSLPLLSWLGAILNRVSTTDWIGLDWIGHDKHNISLLNYNCQDPLLLFMSQDHFC